MERSDGEIGWRDRERELETTLIILIIFDFTTNVTFIVKG